MPFASVSVQKIYAKIEISRKGDPQYIRNQKQSGRFRYFFELNGCDDDEDPHRCQPYKCQQISFHVEEDDRPDKVEKQLYSVNCKSRAPVFFVYKYKIRSYTHEDIENSPCHRKQPGRRGERRFIYPFKNLDAVSCEKGGGSAYCQRDEYADDQFFPLYFYMDSFRLQIEDEESFRIACKTVSNVVILCLKAIIMFGKIK